MNGKIKDKKITSVIFINSDKMETRIERIDRANYLWSFYDSMVCWSIYFPMYCRQSRIISQLCKDWCKLRILR